MVIIAPQPGLRCSLNDSEVFQTGDKCTEQCKSGGSLVPLNLIGMFKPIKFVGVGWRNPPLKPSDPKTGVLGA